jgi:hypothetical protein
MGALSPRGWRLGMAPGDAVDALDLRVDATRRASH